jgi:hypothetical protein
MGRAQRDGPPANPRVPLLTLDPSFPIPFPRAREKSSGDIFCFARPPFPCALLPSASETPVRDETCHDGRTSAHCFTLAREKRTRGHRPNRHGSGTRALGKLARELPAVGSDVLLERKKWACGFKMAWKAMTGWRMVALCGGTLWLKRRGRQADSLPWKAALGFPLGAAAG